MATHREQTTDPGSKSAAEIEREVRQSRAHVEDTLDAIQERLSPGQLFDQAFDYFRGGGGEFVRNLGATVSHNPLPVTLVGVGLAWMMLSDQRSRHRRLDPADWDDDRDGDEDRYTASAYRSGGYEAEVYEAGGYEPGSLHEDMPPAPAFGSEAETRFGDRVSGIGGRAADLGERAREHASDLGDRARQAAMAAKERAEDFGARAGERMADARADLANRAERGSLRARRYGRRARQGAFQAFSDHPLVLGALGLAFGAALGAALPPSETEDELMGEAGDKLQRRAGEAAREQVGKVRSAAESAYAAARHEAEEQGLTAEAAQEASRSTVDKAGKVVDAAVSAAEHELKPGSDRPGDRPAPA